MIVLLPVWGCEMNLVMAYQWIVKALQELDEDRGYRATSKLVGALKPV